MIRKTYPRQIINLDMKSFFLAMQSLLNPFGNREVQVSDFSSNFSSFLGCMHSIPVSSARFGLVLLLETYGLSPGDEVILSTYGYHAMPNVIAALGLKPVFADITETDFNVDPVSVEKSLTSHTKAIMATHIYGQPADMKALRDIADDNDLFLIEDCAEATGAKYKGVPVGTIGDAAVFSFSMGKPLVGLGGGAVTTSDGELARKLSERTKSLFQPGRGELLRSLVAYAHLWLSSSPSTFPVTTFPLLYISSMSDYDLLDKMLSNTRKKEVRLDGIPESMRRGFNPYRARVLLRQLSKLKEMNAQRVKVGETYDALFADVDAVKTVHFDKDNLNIYNAYGIRVRDCDRRQLQRLLLKKGIDTKVRHMYVCSDMRMFREFRRECPVAERVSRELLHLPINHYMDEGDARHIVDELIECLKSC